jgi:hypothetical protein
LANGHALVGELKLEVPDFVELQQDLENRSVALNVQDTTAKQQKEMWGMFFLSPSIPSSDLAVESIMN